MIVLVLERCDDVMLSLLASVGVFDFGDLVGITFAVFAAEPRLVCFDVFIRDDIDCAKLVRKEGFEPSHLTAPPPQDGASANSAASAQNCHLSKIRQHLRWYRHPHRIQHRCQVNHLLRDCSADRRQKSKCGRDHSQNTQRHTADRAL